MNPAPQLYPAPARKSGVYSARAGWCRVKVLYAGDSEAGGPANYLLGILKSLKADCAHIPPGKKLSPSLFKTQFDVILLSDFSRRDTPLEAEKAIVSQAEKGAGLLMIGGWASFSGPFGGWRGSLIEKILPVRCLPRDDRLPLPGGAWVTPSPLSSPPGRGRGEGEGEASCPFFPNHWFKNPPVICGLNQIHPKKGSLVLLTARKISPPLTLSPQGRGKGEGWEYPLLIIHSDPTQRIAALATDLAPHWCGGLVDWGEKRIKIRVRGKIGIEVGDCYVRFVSNLLRWLAGPEPSYSAKELKGLNQLHKDEKKKGWIRLKTAEDINNLLL